MTIDYSALDAAIVRYIEQSAQIHQFARPMYSREAKAAAEAINKCGDWARMIDRRCQALRKARRITWSRTDGWSLVEQKPRSIADLTRQLAEVTRERDALADAARDVVARWETPLWKDAPPTAGLIYRLRDAIPAAPQPAEAKE